MKSKQGPRLKIVLASLLVAGIVGIGWWLRQAFLPPREIIVDLSVVFSESTIYRYRDFLAGKRARKIYSLWHLIDEEGKPVRLPYDPVTYYIDKRTFTQEQYDFVQKHLRAAMKTWESVCNIKFEQAAVSDTFLLDGKVPKELAFVVRNRNINGQYASSFLPFQQDNRFLNICKDFYVKSQYSPEGILRHELGHILGFLHAIEPLGSFPECSNICTKGIDFQTKDAVTSLMRCICPARDTLWEYGTEFNFSDGDRRAAALIYP